MAPMQPAEVFASLPSNLGLENLRGAQSERTSETTNALRDHCAA
jgi:hypothetical protein